MGSRREDLAWVTSQRLRRQTEVRKVLRYLRTCAPMLQNGKPHALPTFWVAESRIYPTVLYRARAAAGARPSGCLQRICLQDKEPDQSVAAGGGCLGPLLVLLRVGLLRWSEDGAEILHLCA